MRSPSKYERLWRERAGHAGRPVTAGTMISRPPGVPDAPPPLVPPPLPAAADPVPPPAPAAAPVVAAPLFEVTFTSSSNVLAARLDEATGVVEVEFRGGKRYRFGGFTAQLMTEWLSADSAGGWFDAHVKKHPDRHPPIGK